MRTTVSGILAWGVIFLLLVFGTEVAVACNQTPQVQGDEPSEHTGVGSPKSRPIMLEPKLYWFYEAMDMLTEVKKEGQYVEGAFTDRSMTFYFTVPTDRLHDPSARTEGYKIAVARIIALMVPGAVPDNEANRKYIAELEAKLKAITRKDLGGYAQWKTWFDANQANLEWSDEKNILAISGEEK
ncbi:MAG: hypothetical protein ACREJQ_05110 [bacterium]